MRLVREELSDVWDWQRGVCVSVCGGCERKGEKGDKRGRQRGLAIASITEVAEF